MITLKGGGTVNFRPVKKSDFPFSKIVDLTILTRLSGGTSTSVADGDAVMLSYAGATYVVEGSVIPDGHGGYEIINLTPDVADVSQSGEVTRKKSGVLKTKVKWNNGLSLLSEVDLTSQQGESDSFEYISAIEGTLATHMIASIDPRIAGKNMANNGHFFTTQNHTTKTYVRNPDLWCADLNLTCISPWNSDGGASKAGVLVTPRHVLNAKHFKYGVRTVVRFIGSDNTVYDRLVVGTSEITSAMGNADVAVYTLDSDLPPAITPCPIVPSNHDQFFKYRQKILSPVLSLDKEEKALIRNWIYQGSLRYPEEADRLNFHEPIVSGDSGNPVFFIVNNQLVLLTTLTSLGGSNLSGNIANINAVIADADAQAGVSTGYTVTEADFSEWPNLITQNYLIEDSDRANGNASLWVEAGTVDGKESYIMRESATDYWTLAWDGAAWAFTATGSPTLFFSDSAPDGATPDLATFSTLNFSTP